MDFRKVEEGRIKIATNYGNLKGFMTEIVPPFVDYAKNRGIDLQLYLRLADPILMFDEDVMRKIMTNLISNALKFTPKGGKVGIYVGIAGKDGEKKLFISVRDTGRVFLRMIWSVFSCSSINPITEALSRSVVRVVPA